MNWALAILLLGISQVGCGITRTSDTQRTATEQLLISDAIDRAVGALSVAELSGQSVFVDDKYLTNVVDRPYLVSSIRQHLIANGCVLRNEATEAAFVVEARAGAVGTNRHDLLFGIPSMNLPQIFPLQGIPAAIPEVPIAKRRDQRGVAKVALFAYHRETGLPVWQSGIAQQESSLNDVWLLGAGPFQTGTIQKELEFTSEAIRRRREASDKHLDRIAREETFNIPTQLASTAESKRQPEVERVEYTAPVPASSPQTTSATTGLPPPAPKSPQPPNSTPGVLDSSAVELELNLDVASQPQTWGWFYSMNEQQNWSSETNVNAPPAFQEPTDLIPLPQPVIDTARAPTAD